MQQQYLDVERMYVHKDLSTIVERMQMNESTSADDDITISPNCHHFTP